MLLLFYFIGRQAEDIFGSRNFFLLYMMSGLMGNIFVSLFPVPDTLSAESTALFGLFASIVTPARQLHSAAGAVLYDLDCGQYHL